MLPAGRLRHGSRLGSVLSRVRPKFTPLYMVDNTPRLTLCNPQAAVFYPLFYYQPPSTRSATLAVFFAPPRPASKMQFILSGCKPAEGPGNSPPGGTFGVAVMGESKANSVSPFIVMLNLFQHPWSALGIGLGHGPRIKSGVTK